MKGILWIAMIFAWPGLAQSPHAESGVHLTVSAEYAKLAGGVRSVDPEPGIVVGLDYGLPKRRVILAEGWFTTTFKNADTSNTFFGWSLNFSGLDLFYSQPIANTRVSFFTGPSYIRMEEKIRLRVDNPRLSHDGLGLGGGVAYQLFSKRSQKATHTEGQLYLKLRHYFGELEDLTSTGIAVQADKGKPTLISLGFRLRLRGSRNK